jgi:hypothetical protein
MQFATESRRKSWQMAASAIGGSWVTLFLGPATLLIVPFLAIAATFSISKRAFWPVIALAFLNPLSVFFAGGMVSYLRGTPTLDFMGLPGIESFNVDRTTRCFRNGGGCLMDGDEWVFLTPHNTSIKLMASVFGPPRRGYNGPYPTKGEAFKEVKDTKPFSNDLFTQGRVLVGDKEIELGQNVTEKLMKGLQFYSDSLYEMVYGKFVVQAVLYHERCLILRLYQIRSDQINDKDLGKDVMVLFDLQNARPFAYFRVKGNSTMRFPLVSYLDNS